MLLSESVASRRSSVFGSIKPSRSKRSGVEYGNSPSLGRSADSRVMVDIDSPNFKIPEQEHHNEIVSSLRNNYLNEHVKSRRSNSVSSHNSKAINSDEDNDLDTLLPEHDPNLNRSGGDITRDLYRLASPMNNIKKAKRNKSFDDLKLASSAESRRRDSTASALNVPGGFRREYIVKKIRNDKDSSTPTNTDEDQCLSLPSAATSESSDGMDKVPFLTRNFLEFLYVYGHFAGECFEDDFYSEEEEDNRGNKTIDERSPLLPGDIESRGGRAKVHAPRSAKGTTSTFKAFLLMIKSFIGTGVLFLPNAFANGGLTFSVCMLSFFGIYSYWCYYILIQSKVATKVSSFGDIGFRLYGSWMKFVILFSLVLTQLGFSGAYVVFTAKNLIAFLDNVFRWHDVPIEYLLFLQLAIFIPLSFIRNVSKLSLTSLIANFLVMAGLIIVVFFVLKHLILDLHFTPAEGVIMGFNSSSWSLFIGTAIFAFEGIGLIIPVQDSMKHPEKFPLVLGLVIGAATVLFVTIATLGYLSYGQNTETVILLNLPQGNLCVNLIQFFYSLAILLSTPLQLFPAIAIIENKVFPRFTKIYVKKNNRTDVELRPNSGKLDWKVKWLKNSVRSVIVSFVILLAYYGSENLDKFVSIVGCFACIPLVYMYPPLLHLRSCSKPQCHGVTKWWKKWPIGLDYLLITFGGVSMIYTSYQCVLG